MPDDQDLIYVSQAQETGGNVSSDTTFDTTAPRPWTPGPWQEGRPDMASIVEGYESKFVRSMAPGHKLTNVAIAYGGHVHDWGTIMANARLIAAAPELYEALAVLMQDVELFVPARHIPSVEQARAAMDKALGVDRG